jgi:hypothetical protein
MENRIYQHKRREEELVLLFGPSIEALDSPGSTAGARN